ncbi:MAG TPA: 2,3,4,5-tetrahydropyridine-2,6-dicarboxylate N-succinyltransferase, partial [Motilibacterales bacterium]|nr:2,3,4,5-tetrahydropyridine-2,6-dicarboxylate N-succinyltransferase [Motilibacterales bacterium]
MELLTSPASGLGIATHAGTSPDSPILDVWYPVPALSAEPIAVAHLEDACGEDPIRGVVTRVVRTSIADLSEPPADVADAYLRLHLLSHRLVAPRTVNVEGIFGVLPNVAWTSLGPVAIESLTEVRMRARVAGEPLVVLGVDKFPRMVDYVVPSGVRI